MRVHDGDEIKPVDLSLHDDGDAFSPTAALEPVRISKDAAGGLSFGGGFTLAPAGQSGATGALTGSSVFYPNVATDTDFVVHPDPTGAETHFLMRSQDSPSSMRMRVGLPPGATLSEGPRDAVDVKQAGDVIGRIAAPAAWDADHVAVPVSMSIDGDEIVLSVDRVGRDLAYPLEVDPSVSAGFFFQYQGDDAFDYWQWFDSTGTGFGSTTGKFQRFGGSGYMGRGLYINVPYPGQSFTGYGEHNGSSEQGFWFYRAPGQARIYHVAMYYSSNDVPASLQLCDFWGIANSEINSFEGSGASEGCTPNYGFPVNYTGAAYNFDDPSATPNNTFLLGEYAYGGGQLYGTSYFRDAQIDMVDYDTPSKPTIQTPQVPPAYIGNPDAVLTAVSDDPSLGVASFTFHGPASWSGNGRVVHTNCPFGPCPQHGVVTTPVDNMPDGQHTISVTADDGLGHTIDSDDYTENVDGQYPTVTETGALYAARGTRINAGTYAMHVHATDAGTGAKYISVQLDGREVARTTTGCPSGSGDCDLDYTFDTTSVPADLHSFVVEVNDASHDAPLDETFTIDTRPATTSDAVAPAWSTGGPTLTGYIDSGSSTTHLDWDPPLDPADPDNASDASSYSYRYRVNAGSWSSWTATQEPSADIGAVPDGSTLDFEVTAQDDAANISPVASDTITLHGASGVDACTTGAGALPSRCITHPVPASDEDDSEISLQPVVDGAAYRSSHPYKGNFKVVLGAGQNYATVRDATPGYAIGTVHNGDILRSVAQADHHDYRLGDFTGLYTAGHCGWIRDTQANTDTSSGGASACNPATFPPLITAFSKWTNCGRDPAAGCKDGTKEFLISPTILCRNAFPIDIKTKPCSKGNIIRYQSGPQAGQAIRIGTDPDHPTCVRWRYLTHDNRYAMVRLTGTDVIPGEAHWVFISRKALKPDYHDLGQGQFPCPGE